MKKLFLLSLCLCSMMLFSCSEDDWTAPDWAVNGGMYTLNKSTIPLTSEDAWNIVKKEVMGNHLDGHGVWVSKNILEPNTVVDTICSKTTSPNYRCWLFFISDSEEIIDGPSPARYVLISEYGEKIVVIKPQNGSMPSWISAFVPLQILYYTSHEAYCSRPITRSLSNLFSYDGILHLNS